MWVAIEGLAMHWDEDGANRTGGDTPEAQSWMAQGGTLDRYQLVDDALNQLADAPDTTCGCHSPDRGR